jgi:AAA domain, putative AbiEii toxin, Type IV TA system/AAA ATPase domain
LTGCTGYKGGSDCQLKALRAVIIIELTKADGIWRSRWACRCMPPLGPLPQHALIEDIVVRLEWSHAGVVQVGYNQQASRLFASKDCETAMLHSVHIQNFRCIEDVRIDGLGAITALVGRNGTGKTAVLEAIRAAAAGASSAAATPGNIAWLNQKTQYDLEFSTQVGRYTYLLQQHAIVRGSKFAPLIVERLTDDGGRKLVDRDEELVHVNARTEPIRIGATVGALPVLLAVLPPDDELTAHIRACVDFFSRIRYYAPTESTTETRTAGAVALKQYQAWLEQLKAGALVDSVLMRIIYLHKECESSLEELKEYLGPNDLALIDDIQIREYGSGDGKFVQCVFRAMSSGTLVPYEMLSFGTQRVLRLLCSALTDDSSVMLVEQPEDGIHSGLMKKLMDLLRQLANPVQLFIASHSSDVFNRLQPEEVRLVSIRDKHTQVRALSTEETGAAIQHMREEGPLTDFLQMVDEG